MPSSQIFGSGFWIGLGGFAIALLGAALTHFRILAPYTGFRISAAAWLLGGLIALGLGLVALVRQGPSTGIAPLLLGAALVAVLLLAAGPGLRLPVIHDVTTNPDDPPTFSEALQHPANAGRNLSYPHGGSEVPALQRQAYPDLEPLRTELSPAEAFDRAGEVAADLGWHITWANAELGQLEGTQESRLFRFVDDIAVRVQADGNGSVLDLRSTSRVGKSDLGANAARIRAFVEAFR